MHQFHHLTDRSTSMLLALPKDGSARVIHWGSYLGDLNANDIAQIDTITIPPVLQSGNDVPDQQGLLADPASGYLGRPALSGHRDGLAWSPLPILADWHGDARTLYLEHRDASSGIAIATTIELVGAGLFRLNHVLTSEGPGTYRIDHLDLILPVPDRAVESLDFGGRWSRERSPGRRPVVEGSWTREGREGRPGHDFPHIFAACTPETLNRTGEVWALSLASSGNWRLSFDRRSDGAGHLCAGEMLLPGEIALQDKDAYSTPWLYAAYSSTGLDGISDVMHGFVRELRGPVKVPKPVYINSWEAVYFEHNLADLRALASDAAALGVERFTLDDGWFRGRRNDSAGLGDWWADPERWPNGLTPLIDHVRGLGMDFGLWVEPEMVNTDSDLYRAHPDWVLRVPERLPIAWRHQQVLNLANPEAFDHILAALDRLLGHNAISFIKWDHNRPLIEAGSPGVAVAHRQQLAVGQLIDALRLRHPEVEFESCASGGGRLDLEMVQRTDRVAISDCVDPTERQSIQRWTNLLLPPELCVTEVAASPSHTTGRMHRLGFRAATALFGQFGIQLDTRQLDAEDRSELAEWIALYKQWRGVIHSGRLVHADTTDTSRLAKGVVSADGDRALFSVAQLQSSRYSPPPPIRLPGLDVGRHYRLGLAGPKGAYFCVQRRPPAWMSAPITLPGEILLNIGLASPVMTPDSVLLIEAIAFD